MIRIVNNLIKKIKNFHFRKKNKKIKGKLFIPYIEQVDRFKKRKKTIRIPNILAKLNIHKNIKYYYISGLGLSIFLLIFLFVWPVFSIKFIEIEKKENITNLDIAYKAVETIRWKSFLLSDGKDISEKLQSYQKNIKEVYIKKIIPNTLKIVIESYKGIYNTTINNKEYIITENGVLIPSKFSEELKELKFTKNYPLFSWILDYKDVFQKKYMDNIEYTHKKISDNLLTEKLIEYYFFPTEREFHIDFEKGAKVIIDISWDIDEQIKKLVIFYKEHLKWDLSWIVYIDLRITNKVFLCKTETEFECRKTLKNIYEY